MNARLSMNCGFVFLTLIGCRNPGKSTDGGGGNTGSAGTDGGSGGSSSGGGGGAGTGGTGGSISGTGGTAGSSGMDASSDGADAGVLICLPIGDAGAATPPIGDAGTATPGVELELIADSHYGFSGTQGGCSWSYGYVEPSGDNTFHLMTDWDVISPLWWSRRETYWTMIGPDLQHPNGTMTTGGRAEVEQWSVRRWTSTTSGNVTISGSVRKHDGANGGDGVDVRILVEGVEKYSRFMDAADTVGVSFVVSAVVAAGSTVDFALGPHTSDAVDTTVFTAQIWK